MADVSVIMTVRNGERHIEDAVQSIVNQTLLSWELILVDDGSTDDTMGRVQRFLCDPRVRVIRTRGVGRARALRMAVEACSGEWIANLDADDIAHPRRLELERAFLIDHPEFALVAAAQELVFDDSAPTWSSVEAGTEQYAEAGSSILYRNCISHSTVMIRGRVLRECGGYDVSRLSQIDYDVWLRLREGGYRLAVLRSKLGAKRIHRGQAFENKKRFMFLVRNLILQNKHIRRQRAPLYFHLITVAGFIYGLLPQRSRMWFRLFRGERKVIET